METNFTELTKAFIHYQINKWCLKYESKMVNEKIGDQILNFAKEELKEMICNSDEDFEFFAKLFNEDDQLRTINKIGQILHTILFKPEYNEQRSRLISIYNNNNFVYTKELEQEVNKISEYIDNKQ